MIQNINVKHPTQSYPQYQNSKVSQLHKYKNLQIKVGVKRNGVSTPIIHPSWHIYKNTKAQIHKNTNT